MVRNAYSFVLMHLCSSDKKNPLGIAIPEICVFHEGVPIDLFYYAEGHIRGYRKEGQRLRRTDIPRLFRMFHGKAPINKECHIIRFVSTPPVIQTRST